MNNIKISIIVCTHNRSDLLPKTIESIIHQTVDTSDYEIIVVDNGSNDGTRQVCEQYREYGNFRYVYEPVSGLSIARNTGVSHAEGEIVAFIDDDAVVSRDCLRAYINAFTNIRPTPAMVGGKILPEWEVPCPSWYPEERKYMLGLYDIGDEIREFPERDLPPGANFAMLRKVIEDFGGFDRRFGFAEGRKNSMIAGEDSLMALNVLDAGGSIYYCPEAEARHFIASYKLTRNYFLRRHYWEGITVVNLNTCRNKSGKLRHTGTHTYLKTALTKGMSSLLSLFKIDSEFQPKLMLNLGYMFYFFGICVESVKLFLRRTGF